MNIWTLINSLPSTISQGILWGVMVLGVYITYKVLDYADLTVDGSFATGGAISAILIIKGANPFLALLLAIIAGMLAGLVTGLLHTKLEIPPILSGILTMLALYSVNIRIMAGQPNISLLGEDTMISMVSNVLPSCSKETISLGIGIVVTSILVLLMYWFFGTEIGCCIRATGNNQYMVRSLGGNTDRMKILGLVLSNGLVALSGALVAQSQGFADVEMGQGTIVIGLASVIIGEVLFGKRLNFAFRLTSVVFGSVIYRIIIAIVLWAGLRSTDLKMLTAAIVAAALAIPVYKRKLATHKPLTKIS